MDSALPQEFSYMSSLVRANTNKSNIQNNFQRMVERQLTQPQQNASPTTVAMKVRHSDQSQPDAPSQVTNLGQTLKPPSTREQLFQNSQLAPKQSKTVSFLPTRNDDFGSKLKYSINFSPESQSQYPGIQTVSFLPQNQTDFQRTARPPASIRNENRSQRSESPAKQQLTTSAQRIIQLSMSQLGDPLDNSGQKRLQNIFETWKQDQQVNIPKAARRTEQQEILIRTQDQAIDHLLSDLEEVNAESIINFGLNSSDLFPRNRYQQAFVNRNQCRNSGLQVGIQEPFPAFRTVNSFNLPQSPVSSYTQQTKEGPSQREPNSRSFKQKSRWRQDKSEQRPSQEAKNQAPSQKFRNQPVSRVRQVEYD